jgi:hypothetical protein
LDTVYASDSVWNRSDSINSGNSGIGGTGLPDSKGRGGSGMDTLRDPDSMNRPQDLDKINDSLGVLDWYERG